MFVVRRFTPDQPPKPAKICRYTRTYVYTMNCKLPSTKSWYTHTGGPASMHVSQLQGVVEAAIAFFRGEIGMA